MAQRLLDTESWLSDPAGWRSLDQQDAEGDAKEVLPLGDGGAFAQMHQAQHGVFLFVS